MEILSKPRESGHFNAELLLITTLSVIIYFFNELFSRYELLSIFIKFVPALLLTAYYLFISRSQIKLFLVGSVVFFVPLFIIAQAVQKDSLASSKYKRIDLGGSFGNFFNEVKYDPQTGACGGTSYSNEYYENTYNIGGLGFAQVVSKGNREITYGAIANFGNITSTRLSTGEKKSEFIFGVNPYFKTEGKWFGYGVGAQVGKFKKNKTETIEASDVEDANKDYNISPEIYLRFGRRDILDIDYRYGFLFPSPFPTAYSRVSLGSGFGRRFPCSTRLST